MNYELTTKTQRHEDARRELFLIEKPRLPSLSLDSRLRGNDWHCGDSRLRRNDECVGTGVSPVLRQAGTLVSTADESSRLRVNDMFVVLPSGSFSDDGSDV